MKTINDFFRELFSTHSIIAGQFGLQYIFDKKSALDQHIKKDGVFDDWIAKHGSEFLSKESVIFDIGANVGLLSLVFARVVAPLGEVFSFEPDPENLHQLQQNVELNQLHNVKIIDSAVQNDVELNKATFYIRRAVDGDRKINRGLSSLVHLPLHNTSTVIANATTIDRQVTLRNLTRLDLLKIDVENAEYLVLSGGQESIMRFKPVIQYEYSIVLDKMSGQENGQKSFHFLRMAGYDQYMIKMEKHLVQISEPENISSDVNILAFHGKPPDTLQKYIQQE